MADNIQLELVTPTQVVAHAEVSEVEAPGATGEFGVLPGHAFYISVLKPGEVRFREGGRMRYFAIGRGFAEVGPDRAVILTDAAEESTSLSADDLQEALRRDENSLKALPPGDSQAVVVMDRIERNRARLAVAQRR